MRSFYRDDTESFALHVPSGTPIPLEDVVDEPDEPAEAGDERVVKGLTTTFTCLESLLDGLYGDRQEGVHAETVQLLANFADKALDRKDDWQSEGAAKTYCRVRSLAPLFRHYRDLNGPRLDAAKTLLREAWSPVRARPGRDGIIEVGNRAFEGKIEGHYPPNAYLSYWALEALLYAPDDVKAELEDRRRIVELWLEKWLGVQVSLHFAESPRCDPQQIAWSIAGLLIARQAPPDERKLPVDELIRAGLRAFFDEQRNDGLWERGDPLFHYPKAGNAYSYVYEALAVLVSLSLGGNEASLSFRRQLEPYVPQLTLAFETTQLGQRVLTPGTSKIGWCSGHHPFRTLPESWATASVFRFLQAFRKLAGLLSHAASARALGARVAQEDLATLAERGRTWNAGYGSAGVQLASLFVHPHQAVAASPSSDPDLPVLPRDSARSALLFGPPGTSKTTLVEAVAGALGWPFIEVSPAAFMNHGIDMVSARADEVFDQLMELDRVVVLLDEIDELIRSRTGDSDPLERFFTTTMLPRLAKLWKRRSILFFVNTNSIVQVDAAVMRSQRFDAALFVLPPGFHKKNSLLKKAGLTVDWSADGINQIVRKPNDVGEAQRGLAWLPFIRWDQMDRLELALKEAASEDGLVPIAAAAQVLHRFGRELVQTDWPIAPEELPPIDADEQIQAQNQRLEPVLHRYRELASYQRRDHDKKRLVSRTDAFACPDSAIAVGESHWRVESRLDDLYQWTHEQGYWMDAAARVYAAAPGE